MLLMKVKCIFRIHTIGVKLLSTCCQNNANNLIFACNLFNLLDQLFACNLFNLPDQLIVLFRYLNDHSRKSVTHSYYSKLYFNYLYVIMI